LKKYLKMELKSRRKMMLKFKVLTAILRILCTGILLGITNVSFAQPGNSVWHEDWEGNWFLDWVITAGTWEVGLPSSGPNNTYMGQKCAATALSGNYGPAVQSRLEMLHPFIVPDAGEYPRLRFWHWYDMAGSDFGRVQIKVDQGNWEDISETYDDNGGAAWTSPMIDLSAYAGQSVKIGFEFSSDGNPNSVSSGWYIDEVSLITGQPHLTNFEDWEAGLGDWYVNKGTWEVGMPVSGPNAAYQGQYCAATVLGGDYSPLANTMLVSPHFVIPDTMILPTLQFQHWYEIGGSDYGEVQLRVKGGEWQAISNPVVSSSGGNWLSVVIGLSPFIGDTVQVGFFFRSDGGGSVKSGWYIDSIELPFPYVVGIDEHTNSGGLIHGFALYQNHPNPFNPATNIRYKLPQSAQVTLKIYNLLGREIQTLVNSPQPPGEYSVAWDGVNTLGQQVSSGIYIYQIQAGEYLETRKMVLLR
jgi:hypothetical protein